MYIVRRIIDKVIKLDNKMFSLFSVFFIFISAGIIHLIEPETFPNFFISIWYVMTTVTTVGYGDIYPVTIAGKVFALILFLVGIGIGGILIGKIIDGLGSFKRKREEGKLAFHGENHIVIIGWSSKAEVAIQEILDTDKSIHIVLIDHLEKVPLLHDRVHYVKGMAADDAILEQANLKRAKAAIVFADDSIKDKQLTDGKTLLIATSIERYVSDIHTMVEVMDERNVKNFHFVKVNDFILPHDMISRLAVRAIFTDGITSVLNQLVRREQGQNLYHISRKKDWLTYKDAFHALLNAGATLVSNGGDLSINLRLDEQIPEDAKLYIICDDETYQKIIHVL